MQDNVALLGELFCERWQHERWPFSLPTPSAPEVERAMRWAGEHLVEATLEGAARAAYTSPRTLTRRFKQDVEMTWRQYLHMARLMEAMERLGAGAPVTRVALEVGFESPSAFTRAFYDFTGELPSHFGG